MSVLAIVILVVLSLFTIYQGYTLVRKIILKKKCKGINNDTTSTENVDEVNSIKEEK